MSPVLKSHTPARRVPVVSQVSQTECGLCCCVSLLRYYGRAEEPSGARREMDAGRDGLGAAQLGRFLRSRGMEVKLFRAASTAALSRFTAPVILHWEDQHFVVLERFEGRQAVVMDPAVGRRRLGPEELEAGFSGIVLLAEPGPDFRRMPRRVLHEWRGLPLFAEGTRKRLVLVGLLSLSGYGAVLGIPVLTKWAVDRYTRWHSLGDLSLTVTLLAAAAAAYFAIQLVRITVLSSVVALLGRHLMTHTFGKLLSLPYSFFSTRPPGELLHRLNSVNMVRDLLSSRVAQGILDAGTLVCVSGYLLTVEWRLGLTALSLFLLNAVYLARTRTRVLEAIDAEISRLSMSQSAQLDAIISIPTIKMGGYAGQFLENWGKVYGSSLDAMKTRMRLQQGRIAGMSSTTQMFGPVVMLLAGLYFVSRGQITIGSAIAVQAVSATQFALATSVFQTYTEFSEVSRHMARLNDITETPSEPPGGSLTSLPEASIRLDGVAFRYTKHSDYVLHDISLDIEPGSKVALVGASGSGKSTLGRIICGLYEPTRGTVRFGGRDVHDYSRDALRRRIGYIPQEVHLHNRTLLENLTMGQDVPPDQVREFCAHLEILDFLEDLPMGLNTLVSEMGTNFSGGQRQRIAIARALLQRPTILLLDEATAALDTVNERRVSELTEDMGVTQVIIAHRLATIRSADRIHVLHQGRVVERGSHTELLANGPFYRGLYTEQATNALVGGE
ncbi:peptidase domain-containing ABC transporter [Streptomyces sp. NPDC057620]|uniref:peptidase domain-containing ABC transporter n=1 Tax=Streptomyces sp. NPDC057620 TaxID=3346185 RepID=UPI0036BBFC5F